MLTRRHFLQSLVTVGAAAASLPPSVHAALAGQSGRGSGNIWQQTQLFMGTMVGITVARVSQQQADDAMAVAFARGRELEAGFNRFDSASAVSVLNAQGTLADCPPEWQAVMDGAARIHNLTGGAFDATVLPLLALMEQKSGHPDGAALAEARALVGQDGLAYKDGAWRFARQGMGLTLDGIAKGHIAQQMSAVLAAQGCTDHMVNAGGDIVTSGSDCDGRPWRVGIADPAHRNRHVRTIAMPLSGGAIATSGTTEFRFDSTGRSNHLLLPRTGASSTLASVTVQAPTGLEADALATACSVMAPAEALRLVAGLGAGYDCVLVSQDRAQVTASARPRRT